MKLNFSFCLVLICTLLQQTVALSLTETQRYLLDPETGIYTVLYSEETPTKYNFWIKGQNDVHLRCSAFFNNGVWHDRRNVIRSNGQDVYIKYQNLDVPTKVTSNNGQEFEITFSEILPKCKDLYDLQINRNDNEITPGATGHVAQIHNPIHSTDVNTDRYTTRKPVIDGVTQPTERLTAAPANPREYTTVRPFHANEFVEESKHKTVKPFNSNEHPEESITPKGSARRPDSARPITENTIRKGTNDNAIDSLTPRAGVGTRPTYATNHRGDENGVTRTPYTTPNQHLIPISTYRPTFRPTDQPSLGSRTNTGYTPRISTQTNNPPPSTCFTDIPKSLVITNHDLEPIDKQGLDSPYRISLEDCKCTCPNTRHIPRAILKEKEFDLL